MKVQIITVSIILLLLCVNITGMATKPDDAYARDLNKIRFVEPQKHSIQINCTSLDGGIYFINDILLDKKDILENKVCFALNKDFVLTEVSTDKVGIPLRFYSQFKPVDFIPELDAETQAILSTKCSVFELAFRDTKKLPETVSVRIKYHLKKSLNPNSDFAVFNEKVQLNSKFFWFPRDISTDVDLSVLIKTTDKYAYSLNGEAMSFNMKQNFKKEYRHEIKESKEQPLIIIFHSKS